MAFHVLFMSSKSSSLSLTIIIITLLIIVIMLLLMIMMIIMIMNYSLMYFSGGSKWKTRRRQITPTFHFRILNNFIQVFEEQAVIMVSHLEKKVKKGVFNIMPYISRCALDVICVTSMDSSPNAQENVDSSYVNAVLRMSELVQKRQRSPWLWYDALYYLMPSGREHSKCLKILHDFTNKVIDERIAERAARTVAPQENQEDSVNDEEVVFKRKKRQAFLDLLLEAYDNGEISREGVREEVDTFMFEGHDTTAAGITWALYLLARHPEIQQRTHEEVDNFFAQRPDILTVEDLKQLRYLECVIKEAQRLFPSVPFIGRAVSEDYSLSGYIAPKGTTIVTAIVSLHRNPEVWPAPLQFDPDRFLPENSQGRHPFAFIPFSAGPRNCIGRPFCTKLFFRNHYSLVRFFRNITYFSLKDSVLSSIKIRSFLSLVLVARLFVVSSTLIRFSVRIRKQTSSNEATLKQSVSLFSRFFSFARLFVQFSYVRPFLQSFHTSLFKCSYIFVPLFVHLPSLLIRSIVCY
ncbi:cytochrome P450 4V2-like isoform X3 [Acropora palmata]|uniref:cytochrome P450 4V2-like isoform X3 n=1 Tax=Acropora palmata TaxID=6131 RepID=UPI003DA09EB8